MSMKMRLYADDVTVAAELPSVPSRPSTRTQQRQLKLARENQIIHSSIEPDTMPRFKKLNKRHRVK